MQSSASVNLVKTQANTYGNIVHWALTVGKVLIIVTEIIAFSAFIYRFTLDRTIIDLHTKIKQEKIILDSLKEKEATYRNVQERISLVKQITIKGNAKVDMLNDILSLTPQGITFNSFDFRETELNIDSNVESVSSLTTFTKSLKSYSKISSVNISNITTKADGSGINVFLMVKFKGAQ